MNAACSNIGHGMMNQYRWLHFQVPTLQKAIFQGIEKTGISVEIRNVFIHRFG